MADRASVRWGRYGRASTATFIPRSIGGNDLKIRQRVVRRGDLEQAVVGAKLSVFTSGTWRDAKRGLAPLHALVKRLGRDHQVIKLSFHDLCARFMPRLSRHHDGESANVYSIDRRLCWQSG